jgi:lipopolysaccharide/colanic/teichoic acid biosynthesis glycosyltransferase
VKGGTQRRGYRCCKRTLDVLLSALGLLALSPFMSVIAVLIKLDSRGPAFFFHERVGCKPHYYNGQVFWELRRFRLLKFRSMKADSDDREHENCVRDYVTGCKDAFARNGTFKIRHDPRVTRLGAFLRKTSIDELPQLLNVLKGDVSLVGPRPVPPYEVALYSSPHFARFTALPGITGPWQVKGRCELPFDEMIRLDTEYARAASIWLDFKIMLLTIPAVIFGRGAE